ncbi:TetR/AcrR family transcriptional regulator [Saccharothrix algeriensis]|uniref:AcrR family transcriptional regulator n=2 Tax=Saccharothrix algeriensis TaxID=173560 RepID=A0ABS2S3M4_9PSEU|nr:TetR/AcrR family transcriptional regulator [Saccharothrix algeriensis]MBM7810843.1 AcrR family transcriptional regulator [Saccharothrix algeriensis]
MHENPAENRLAKVMRRQPVQQRGAATVTAIVDACAQLLNQYDYDDITTARIVELAGVPIGSFYQYFPDKRSVVHALALRGMEEYLTRVEALFTEGRLAANWREAVQQVVAVYLRMTTELPGFGRVRFSDLFDGHRLDASVDQYDLMAERLRELFVDRFAVRGDAPVDLSFRMATQTADAMYKLAERVSPAERPVVLRTADALILRLLAGVFDPA